jgi:pterin-4a-carbinolamine dehydratase
MMEISYDEAEDILFIRFNHEPIVRDISYGWHVNVGMTEHGIGQITVLDAKAANLLPIYLPPIAKE